MADSRFSFLKRVAEPGPVLLAGAHSALSARLIEEASFDAVWASGFEISASRGVPDANILTMAENLEVARQMADAVSIPVIADCDNGFGSAINVIRTVTDYERAGIAGICIEDNVFPKRCSFYAGVARDLVSVEEHAAKIRAADAARRDKGFAIIARTEALIAGWGLNEALKRAHAYAGAGADLILVHSKQRDFEELEAFALRWEGRLPLVAVPTTYKDCDADMLAKHGFKVVIFANHAIRSSIHAMQETLRELRRAKRPSAVDDRIVPLEEVYRLIGVSTMKEQERAFLPAGERKVRAVILAAGDDEALGPLTANRPRCMLDVKGRPILERQVEVLNACGIHEIAVVRGYRKESIDAAGLTYFDNDEFESTGEAASLFAASSFLEGRVLVLYGDILFERHVLEKLLQSQEPVSLVIDRSWVDHRGACAGPGRPDLVRLEGGSATAAARQMNLGEQARVRAIGRTIEPREADGEFIGMALLAPVAAERLLALRERLGAMEPGQPFHEAPSAARASLTDLFAEMAREDEGVAAVEIYKGWMDVDSFEDYRKMWAETTR